MNKIIIIFLTSILLFSCERNDMFEVANSGKTKLSITPGDGQLILSWTPVSGAVAYEIWHHTSDDPIAAVMDVEGYINTNYNITSLTNGTLYYVWLKVLYTAGGPAEIIASGSGIPMAIPSAPPTPSITPGDSQLTFNWMSVAEATSYEVYFNTVNDAFTAAQVGGVITGTSYVLTGLTNGTTYYMWVKAKNSVGTSGFSSPANGTPIL